MTASRSGIRVPGTPVPHIPVPISIFTGGPLRPFDGHSGSQTRVLSSADVRRGLPPPPAITGPAFVDILTDLSGSMWGGNDAKGLRHEVALIALEHLASRRSTHWHTRITSFDQNSSLELPLTRLDTAGRRAAQKALLSASPGGSSNLGPCLRSVEAQASQMPRLLVVLSDFELFDPDLPAVYDDLRTSSATHVLALVFSSSPPAELVATGVEVHRITPSGNPPADVARLITAAATKLATPVSSPTDSKLGAARGLSPRRLRVLRGKK